MWGPYLNPDYLTWENSKTERVHTQFLKQVLGCHFQTSNNMVKADTGCRPLISMVIKRYISYTESLKNRKSALCYDSIIYETGNTDSPDLDINDLVQKSKPNIDKICDGNYDRFWKRQISESSKALSFNKYKTGIAKL